MGFVESKYRWKHLPFLIPVLKTFQAVGRQGGYSKRLYEGFFKSDHINRTIEFLK